MCHSPQALTVYLLPGLCVNDTRSPTFHFGRHCGQSQCARQVRAMPILPAKHPPLADLVGLVAPRTGLPARTRQAEMGSCRDIYSPICVPHVRKFWNSPSATQCRAIHAVYVGEGFERNHSRGLHGFFGFISATRCARSVWCRL